MENERIKNIFKKFNYKKQSDPASSKDYVIKENRYLSSAKHKEILENKHFPAKKSVSNETPPNLPNMKNMQNSSLSNFYQSSSSFFKSTDRLFSSSRANNENKCLKEKNEDLNENLESTNKRMSSTFNSKIPGFISCDINNLLSCYNMKLNVISNSKSSYDKNLLDKDSKSKLLQKFRITKHLNNQIKDEIIQNLQSKKTRNNHIRSPHTATKTKLVINDEYFKDPFKSFKKINVNKQIVESINNLVNEKKIEAYLDVIRDNEEMQMKLKRMRGVREIYIDEKSVKDIIKNNNGLDNKISQLEPDMARSTTFENLELQGRFLVTQKNKPIARHQTACFKDHNKVYLFGGLSHTKLDDLWVCDMRNIFQWTKLETSIKESYFPLGRCGHSLIKYNEELFIYGGTTNNDGHPDRDNIVTLNLNNNKLTSELSLNNKEKQKCPRNHTSNLVGNLMITLGGYDNDTGDIKDEVSILDLTTLMWSKPEIKGEGFRKGITNHCSTSIISRERLYHPNFNIYHFHDVPHSKKIKYEGIYYFGGVDRNNHLTNEIKVLRLGKKPLEWHSIPHQGGTPPSERCGSTFNYYDNLNVIFMFGGMNFEEFFNDLFMFDLENYYWYKVRIFDQLPLRRAEHVSFISDNGLVLFGGRNETMFLGSEMYVINLDIFEKNRKKKSHSSLNLDRRIMSGEPNNKNKGENVKKIRFNPIIDKV